MATRRETLEAYNNNIGQKEYRFIFVTNSGGIVPIIVELEYAPDGWVDEVEIERSQKYKGLFRKYSSNELKFPKDGRTYLKNIYESKGIGAESILWVEKLNKNTFEYDVRYIGKFDFSTYKIDEIYASIQVLDNLLTDKVKNRENIEVDLLTNISVNGTNMTSFGSEATHFDFPSTTIGAIAQYAGGTAYSTPYMASPTESIRIGLALGFSQIPECEDQSSGMSGDYFYRNAPSDTQVRLVLATKGDLAFSEAQFHSVDLTFTLKGASSGDVVIKNIYGLKDNEKFEFSNEYVSWLNISSGDNLYVEVTATPSVWPPINGGIGIYLIETYMYFEVEIFDISQHQATGFQYYEGLLRVLQKLTDKADVFYSEFFGRTDTPIQTYAADGELGVFTKGQLIRGVDTNIDVNFSVTLKEMFESLNAVFNIGMGIETIGGNEMVRIEDMAHFFDTEVILDLSSRISPDQIGKEVLPDWHYSQVITGYKKYENEIDGALFEYNGKQTYTTIINSLMPAQNTLDIQSKYRADSNGINLLRNKFGDADSEDVKGDDETFIVDTIRDADPAINFIARQDDGFDYVDEPISNGEGFNYRYTPKRNMLRHGPIIRAGLEKANLNSYLIFQATERVVQLTSKLTAEADEVTEMSNERANDLDAPMWWPEAYVLDECPFFSEDLAAVDANPYGIIKLAENMYGWVLKIKTNVNDKAEIKLLRVNLDHVTPV